MRSLAYFIREALKNSQKNFSTTIGAIVTIFLSLLIIGIFVVISLIINSMVTELENQVALEVFLADEAQQADVDALSSYVDGLEYVDEVRFVSKEEAMIEFRESNVSSEIAAQIDGNPLPASLEISLTDPEQVETVAAAIQGHETFLRIIHDPEDITKSVNYGEDYVDKLFAFNNIVRIVSAALVILLIFVALIFINNTIRLAIMARRKEIAIMRLVGASNGFIRGPFLMEGTLQALVGAGLAIGAMSLITGFVLEQLTTYLPWLPASIPQPTLWLMYLGLLVVGIIIGLFGSMWAMRRYLKV